MKSDNYAVLMAGGVGSRFWPVSTKSNPKQFHDMLGTGKTLIQTTFDRLKNSIPVENILILTNELYLDLVLEQLPEITKNQVISEPAMRNTAPCILYASLKIQKMNPNAVVLVAPSDHWIEDEEAFSKDIQTCFDAAKNSNKLFTLGVKPTFPNTGYGYIQFDKKEEKSLKKVVQFREKPNYDTAKKFIASGNFVWNAGIFIWSVETIVDVFKKHQPVMASLFEQGIPVYNTEKEASFIEANYSLAEDISIDYAVLEKSKNVYVLPVNFDWNDLGTWGSLYDKLERQTENNVVVGARLVSENSSRNIVYSSNNKKVVVLDGVNDYIVVDRDDVLLVYPKHKEQEIKAISAKAIKEFGEL